MRERCGYIIDKESEGEEWRQDQRESGQDKNDSDNKTFNDGKSRGEMLRTAARHDENHTDKLMMSGR